MAAEVERVVEAVGAFCAGLASVDSRRVRSRREPGAYLSITDVPIPGVNGVIVVGADVPVDLVRDLVVDAATDGLPFALEVRPSLEDCVAPVAEDLGLVRDEDIPLMAIDNPSRLDGPTPPDLVVRELGSTEIDVHARLGAEGFEMPLAVAQSLAELTLLIPGHRMWVGEVGSTPVTTALSLPSGPESVGLFNVATPLERRGQGYGGAITAAVARAAFADGADFVWLQSSRSGHGVYQRLGFRDLEAWPLWVGGVLTPDP